MALRWYEISSKRSVFSVGFCTFSYIYAKMAQAGPRWPKMAPGWPQDGPKWPQDSPKMAQRWPQDGPRWPQDGPGQPKTAPRQLQDNQDGPKIGHDNPKMTQDGFRYPEDTKTLYFTRFWGPFKNLRHRPIRQQPGEPGPGEGLGRG